MSAGKIAYLGELFDTFQRLLREIVSGELNTRGLCRRYRMLARTLRQISETADGLADAIEKVQDELLALAGRCVP